MSLSEFQIHFLWTNSGGLDDRLELFAMLMLRECVMNAYHWVWNKVGGEETRLSFWLIV